MGADVDARGTGTGTSPSPSPWPSCRARFGGGGGHVLGERLVLLVVVRSRWEGVDGVQNVSAVGHARQSQMKRARVCAGLALGIILCLGGIFDCLYAIVLVARTFETSACG